MNLRLRDEILADLINRSTAVTVGLTAIAGVGLVTGFFSATYAGEIRSCCLLSIFLSVLRALIVYRCKKSNTTLDDHWRSFIVVVACNGLVWGITFSFAMLDMRAPSWSMSACAAIIFAICNASVITLANDRLLHALFNLGIGIPALATTAWIHFTYRDNHSLLILLMLASTILYSFAQSRRYRLEFIKKWQTDIALFKSQQELIEQRAMNEHVNRLSSIGEMASGFAHEINNPLAIVIGNLEILETELNHRKVLDEQTSKIIQRTMVSASRIAKIIKGLRTLSRKSSREGNVSTSLESILEETLVLYEQRLAATEIKLTVDNQATTPFECDPIQIGQILLNLIGNACDEVANHPRGERWIKLTALEYADSVIVDVINSGPPISEALRRKIFSPFFTTKPVGQGMGLGLVISRSIARQHHGSLELFADQGVTCFRLKLPLTA